MEKTAVYLLYRKSLSIVNESGGCIRQTTALLDCISRFLKVHEPSLCKDRVQLLSEQIQQFREDILKSFSPLQTVAAIGLRIAQRQVDYVASSEISELQAATDELAHQFMVLPVHLVTIAAHFEACVNHTRGPIRALGSVPSSATIVGRLISREHKAEEVSTGLYEVSLQLAELRIAMHRDPNGADDTYTKRRRTLSNISFQMYGPRHRTQRTTGNQRIAI